MRTVNQKVHKRWTSEEDLRLIRQVQAFPQNLHKCFMIVAEELDRTESSVAGRWYNKLSQDPLFLMPLRSKEAAPNIWQRFLRFIHLI